MRPVLILCVFLLSVFSGTAQSNAPVRWQFDWEKVSEGLIQVKAQASIEAGWYVYSQHLNGEGPIPTQLTIDPADGFKEIGEPTESGDRVEGYDEIFGMDIVKFKNTATFSQEIRVTKEAPEVIKGYVLFMCCNDEQCLPPNEVPFSLSLR